MNIKPILALTAVLTVCACRPQNSQPVYLNPGKPLEERVEDALSRMTLEEKVALTHAQSKFSSAGVPRLGIPELWHTDGPHGIRPEVLWDEWDQAGWTNDSCTAFPALSLLESCWERLSPDAVTHPEPDGGKCLDHVFALRSAAAVEVLSSRVLPADGLSDHLPVRVTLRF